MSEPADRGLAALPSVEALTTDLVTLVRIGFLVTVGNRRAEPSDIHGTVRDLLFTILRAADTDAAVAALPHGEPARTPDLDARLGKLWHFHECSDGTQHPEFVELGAVRELLREPARTASSGPPTPTPGGES